ncbi:MAG: zf-HC2 domain-containing protein [Anaerohalosphaera sp.]|nr:zf-HC2 domain-containing protein [Anaerohalosphaera sp.]
MNCDDYKDLLTAYLDKELTDEQKAGLEEHLKSCESCKGELNEFRKLISITDDIALQEPEDKLWESYWSGGYNRFERGIGWILFGVAAIVLMIYGGFKFVESIVVDPTIGVLLKIGILAMIVGLSILFVSVLRERLFFWKNDRYKDVRR